MLHLQTAHLPTGVRYWVEWADWDGNWSTDLMDSPDSAIAIAKLSIDANLSQKIVQFKPR